MQIFIFVRIQVKQKFASVAFQLTDTPYAHRELTTPRLLFTPIRTYFELCLAPNESVVFCTSKAQIHTLWERGAFNCPLDFLTSFFVYVAL